MRTGRVPNRLTYAAIVGGIVYWAAVGWLWGGASGMWDGGTTATLAMLAGLIPFALLVLTAGLGGGDMKLMAAVGACSTMWQVVLATTVYALIVAVVMAVVVMVRRGVVKQTLSRIVGAALLSRSGVKAELPSDGPKVPFAAAVAVGFAVAGAEQMLGVVTPWASWGP